MSDDKAIIDRYRLGDSLAVLAIAYNTTPADIKFRLVAAGVHIRSARETRALYWSQEAYAGEALDVPSRNRGRPSKLVGTMPEDIVRLRSDGTPIARIADHFALSGNTVRRVLKRADGNI